MKRTIGIIGCGAIGRALVSHIDDKMRDRVSRILLFDTVAERSRELSAASDLASAVRTMPGCASQSDLLVEAAAPSAVPGILDEVLRQGTDVMVLSIGGLLDDLSYIDRAEKEGVKLILPSGAIAGIDGLISSRIAGIEKIELNTSKPPRSLRGADYVTEKGVDLDSLQQETVIFAGPASEAMKAFPKNINVSALLSIIGRGADKTMVRIKAVPGLERNVHQISVKAASGSISVRVENLPSPDNPGTSYLASLSAMAAVEQYFSNVRLGT